MKNPIILFLILFLALLLSACGLLPSNDSPPSASATAVSSNNSNAQSDGNDVLSVPILPSATATPNLPTLIPNQTTVPETAVPVTVNPSCEFDIAFVADVTIADGTAVPRGASFEKIWRVLNTGSCAWEQGSQFVFHSGDTLGADASALVPKTEPGEVADITVWFVAPRQPGTYFSDWRLLLPHGEIVDVPFYVQIVVPLATSTPIPRKPTSAASGEGGEGGATSTPAAATVTSTPTVSSSDVWLGRYYANDSLDGDPALVREDASLAFDWGTGAAADGLPVDNFSVSWTRNVDFVADVYRFTVLADDGVRLFVGSTLIIDEWHLANSLTYVADVIIPAGVHTIDVDYFEAADGAKISVAWEPVGSFAEWKGEYWPNSTLTADPLLVRNETAVNFDWGAGSPATGFPSDKFSARWTRTVAFTAATYRFTAARDDGMRVYIDDIIYLDDWESGELETSSFDVVLTAGDHTIRVEYFEDTGNAIAQVSWEQLP